ncbi:hypothetical protein E2C01_007008 [Portunus trituberculatus]|uniref:Uncharacterized protein n=1 Tax=Portunus trituberculatus TaxID=210409 RepID=A0A5B7CYA9_PORTR|nr:hypothetical protein [Portunus trituberculatus]
MDWSFKNSDAYLYAIIETATPLSPPTFPTMPHRHHHHTNSPPPPPPPPSRHHRLSPRNNLHSPADT